MLSKEQIAIMQWIQAQSSAPTMDDMERSKAPGFSRQRVEQMRRSGLLCLDLISASSGEGLCSTYSVSDLGRIELLKLEQERHQRAKEEQRYREQQRQAEEQNVLSRKQNRLTLAQLVVSILSFLAGILAEHYVGLFDWFQSLFR